MCETVCMQGLSGVDDEKCSGGLHRRRLILGCQAGVHEAREQGPAGGVVHSSSPCPRMRLRLMMTRRRPGMLMGSKIVHGQ